MKLKGLLLLLLLLKGLLLLLLVLQCLVLEQFLLRSVLLVQPLVQGIHRVDLPRGLVRPVLVPGWHHEAVVPEVGGVPGVGVLGS